MRGVRPKDVATAEPFPPIFWACPAADQSAIQGFRTYEYTATQSFSVVNLGQFGAACQNSINYTAAAIKHLYSSEAEAKRDASLMILGSNSAVEKKVLKGLQERHEVAGVYRFMGDGPQYMLFSDECKEWLDVRSVASGFD